MRWQLHNGTIEIEATEEATIVDAIRRGQVPLVSQIRREGAVEWLPLRSHVPFAMALDAGRPAKPKSDTKAILAIVGGTALVGTVVLAVTLGRPTSPPPAKAEPVASVDRQAPQEPAPPPPTPEPKSPLALAQTFAAAAAAAKPLMQDVTGQSSSGALALTVWGAAHGKWADIAVKKDETTFARVMKDSDEERGKRYCASGSIIQIESIKTDVGKVAVGLLMDDSAHLWHFNSFGSSGAIVERSAARICGAVIGRYDYSNSGGGVGHAVDIVGMFDIPANRKP